MKIVQCAAHRRAAYGTRAAGVLNLRKYKSKMSAAAAQRDVCNVHLWNGRNHLTAVASS